MVARLKALPSRLSTQAPRLKLPPKSAEPFYRSAEWRRLVARRKLDADYFAALRRAKRGERLILDHVHEIKDGGALLDPLNTEWLTISEHNRKTAKKRGERALGRT
jgi:hypothetical protein